MPPTDFKLEVGHRFQFHTEPRGNFKGVVDCQFLTIDAPRVLMYSWRGGPECPADHPTVVSWTLTPIEGGTKVQFAHTGFTGLPGFIIGKLILGPGWAKMLRGSLRDAIARWNDPAYAANPTWGPAQCDEPGWRRPARS